MLFRASSILAVAFLCLVVAATPDVVVRENPARVPFVKRVNKSADTKQLLNGDRARVTALRTRAADLLESQAGKVVARSTSVPTTNEVSSYFATASLP